MSILGWLFGKSKVASQARQIRPSLAIPTPDDYPQILREQGEPYKRPPHRKGKRYTDEEREAKQAHHNEWMLPRNIAKLAYDRKRLESINVTHFIWLGCGEGSGWCKHCREMSGKKFAFADMPPGKAPGTFICDSGHVCRCICESVLP